MRHDRLELPGSVAASPGWRPVRVGFCALAFVGFGLGGVILARLILPLVALFPGGKRRSRLRCQRVVRAAWILFHDYMRVTGLVAFDHRKVALSINHPSVIIANHPTLIDITALVCAVGPVCFVAKRPLFRNPLFGPLLRACGHICSADRDDGDGEGALEQALARLAEGHSVLLFPEGTRSRPHGLNRFRMGAFVLARQAQVPLVVVGIGATPLALNKGVPWYAIPPVAMRLSLTPVLTFSDWDRVPNLPALSALRDQVRESLLNGFVVAS